MKKSVFLYWDIIIVMKAFHVVGLLNHLFRAKSKFKIHSPFVYELTTKVFHSKVPVEVLNEIKKRRKALRKNRTILEIVDFGAGSQKKKKVKSKITNASYRSDFKAVQKIARTSLLRQKYVNLVYNLVAHLNPGNIVELGTSLGITTSAMAMAAPNAKIYSLEGCASIASVAQGGFDRLGLKNIQLKLGEFDTVLPNLIKNLNSVDLVFFDGNHRKKPTIKYFKQFLPLKHNDTVFIFDDIHWSKGMLEAWNYIKDHPDTVVTIDLFEMGIVFFRKELTPQYFIYRF